MTPTAALPDRLDAVRTAVSARLPQVLDAVHTRWADLDPAVGELVGPARTLVTGGKRMRAVLGTIGYAVACATLGESWEEESWAAHLADAPALRLGAALELYQASALIHDDYMDGAPTRRGAPSAHRRFAALHRDRAWGGEAAAFGASGAILLGDLLLSVAGEEMDEAVTLRGARAGAGEPASMTTLLAARRAFDAMTAEVAVGQYLDVRSQVLPLDTPSQDEADLRRALTVVQHKSARYTVVHPLLIGAALGGLSAEHDAVEALRVMAEWIGVAFQLRDDELGVFGDPAVTGKPSGDDLREGKRTALVALTRARADEAGRTLIDGVLGRADVGGDEVEAVRTLMEDCGARAAHENLIAVHQEAGFAALDAAASDGVLGPVATSDLRLVVTALVTRSA